MICFWYQIDTVTGKTGTILMAPFSIVGEIVGKGFVVVIRCDEPKKDKVNLGLFVVWFHGAEMFAYLNDCLVGDYRCGNTLGAIA